MKRRSFLKVAVAGLGALAGCVQRDPNAPTECPFCKGKGRVNCVGCEGSGKVPKYATRRVRSPETVPCDICGGEGGFTCTMCDGSGKGKAMPFHAPRPPSLSLR